MSDDRLGREADNETSNLSLEKTTEAQQHSNVGQANVDSGRDLEKTDNGSFDHMTASLPQESSTSPTKAAQSGREDTYPEGGLQGWLVVLGSFSGMLASFGQMNERSYLSMTEITGA
ncbi:MAG: hypothetical protein Q9207_005990 [Kuettlingeria erythrocarpa]